MDIPPTGKVSGDADQPAETSNGEGAAPVVRRDGSKTSKSKRKDSLDDLSVSLRQAYQSTLEEQVPDSIMDLLRQLE